MRSEGKGDDTPESLIFGSMHHWKGVTNLSDEELYKHVERSQDDVLLSLTPMFETFLESPFFQEVKQAEAKEEKRRFSASTSAAQAKPAPAPVAVAGAPSSN